MGTILIYDADFYRYNHVIPNLECAKYAAWRKKKRDIVVSSPSFEPDMYTKTFYRKEYDDGIFDKRILKPNVEYGGRAFSDVYQPFDMEMEKIEPDFSIYDKYRLFYSDKKRDQTELKTILYATHVRLSLDGKTLEPFPFDRMRPAHPSLVFHDYDIAAVDGALDLLKEVCDSRPSGLKYRIGNKFPINVYNYEDLRAWLELAPMGPCFYLQYNGVLTDEEIIDLVEKPALGLRQLVYNFTYECRDETDFMLQVLPQIYKQALFLRSCSKRILLNIDTDFFKTKELLDLMKLIDCFYGKTINQWVRPHKTTLYSYCAWHRRAYLEVLPWIHFSVTQDEMRAAFQYMRVHNYEVFDMFYSIPNIITKGGKLVNEWTANKGTD